jgi:hypothetical protein
MGCETDAAGPEADRDTEAAKGMPGERAVLEAGASLQAYREARALDQEAIPLEQALDEIEWLR